MTDLPLSPISLTDTTSQIVKPPPTPTPWLWQCHRCYTVYKVACTRRCFECGHELCTAASVKSSGRDPCRSLFDHAGWEAWGTFRRIVQASRPAGTNISSLADPQKKRRRNSEVDKDKLATWTPAADTHDDSRTGCLASSWQWHAVIAEERDNITRQKEKMYIRREHNCWLHCDAPSECRLAVCTACIEGRARLVGRVKPTAVLLEDNMKKNKKDKKKTNRPEVTTSVESDGESRKSETEGEKECVIMRTFRRKKAQILDSERRRSTEITTAHVESLQETAKNGDATGEKEDNDFKFGPTKPRSLLAALIKRGETETETRIGCFPFEPSHDDEEPEESDDVGFAELLRVSSNLFQKSGSICTSTASSTALVSPPDTDVNIISINDTDGLHSSATQTEISLCRSTSALEGRSGHGGLSTMYAPSVMKLANHAEGFVDLKDLETGHLIGKSGTGTIKRQRDDQQEKQTTRSGNIFSPSPTTPLKHPVWKDCEDDNHSSPATTTPGKFENSASDLMDIISSSDYCLALSLSTATASISLVTSVNTTRESLPSPPLTPYSPDNSTSSTIDHDLSIHRRQDHVPGQHSSQEFIRIPMLDRTNNRY